MILKDPIFLDKNLKGLYLWESGYENIRDVTDNKIKFGVQIVPLHEVINKNSDYKLLVRKINCNKLLFNNFKLKEINSIVKDKHYDIFPKDWFNALIQNKNQPKIINRFWCSSLVGFIYTKCGILKKDTNWSLLTPNDFTLTGENLNFETHCHLDNYVFEL